MPRNVELKAQIDSIDALTPKVAAIATEGPFEVDQDDTFFPCPYGRLKLRAFSKDEGELIFYHRTDQQGPRESFHVRSLTPAPDALRDSLSHAYGQAGRVRKHRTVYLVGRTRVHLDDVDQLGQFVELEVVLEESEPTEHGVREAHELMAVLGILPSQLVEGAYVDRLARLGKT